MRDLRAIAPVTAVRGNIDTGAWAEDLPRTAAIQVGQVGIYIVHTLPSLDLIPEAAGFQVVVSGHSHRPAIEERSGVLFVNPGSAGPRRFNLPVTLAVMSVQGSALEANLVALDP